MKKLLLGTRKGLVEYQQTTNGKWKFSKVAFKGIPVSYFYVDERSNTWWACLDHGHWGCKMHKSSDEGNTWIEVAAPKYPEGCAIKAGVPAATRYLWAMAHGGTDKPDTLYVGTEPGGMFSSHTNGDSFELVESLWNHPSREAQWFGGGRDHAAIHSILVDPDHSNHIYVGISVAGVFETLDGGEHWTPRNKGLKADFLPDPNSEVGQDPHLIDWCAANRKVMWQQNHCGIYRTEDGGMQWTDISDVNGEANFGFAIAANDTDENMAWVVPAVSDEIRVAVDLSLCVCRTDDGGNSWKTFRNGLPQGSAFDITFRHALDQQQGLVVFGTTTGNLFFSKDYGENWETINNNLPMVYTVNILEG